jgi:hypothetical protein
MYLLNAISLNMIKPDRGRIEFEKIESYRARFAVIAGLDEIINCIGHADTDRVVRNHLGEELDIPIGERRTVQLDYGDCALVAQYRGERLPEGCTELPEGSSIEYYWVKIN